jgi:hypothetical protein
VHLGPTTFGVLIKSGNIDRVAGAVQTSTDGCINIENYTNATDDCGNAADQKTAYITRQ